MARQIALDPPPASWRERWHGWRDRLLADPAFQRRAMAFPLGRWIARRRARALFDLTAGFVYSQVLVACVRLRLLEILAEGPAEAGELAPRLGLKPDAALCLLEGAAALRLAARRAGGRFGLGAQGAAFLGNPGARAMVLHHDLLYADLADPVALLRDEPYTTHLSRYWSYAKSDHPGGLTADRVEAYSRLMAESQAMVAGQVLDAWSPAGHRRLLDIGGGDGTFLEAVAARAPDLDLVLFDLPAVAERAEQRLRETGMSQRVRIVGGDFFTDPLPQGADVVSLVRVLHDHDDARARRLLERVRTALPASGTLLIAEPMAGTPGAETVGAYFGFYLLAMGSGRPRSLEDLERLLDATGFGDMRSIATRMPLLARVLVARRL